MHGRIIAGVGTLAWLLSAAPALADDGAVRSELDSMRQRVEAQDRRIRELEGTRMTLDEVSSAIDRYLAGRPQPLLVGGGGGADGSAGFPLGKKPFIKEGPNEVRFVFRNQVRYQWFHYSDHAVGTLATPANTISDAAPRDRSGFEIERLYFGLEGSLFCPDITYNLVLNFDADSGSGVEKEFMWLDWKYSGEHHVRAGVDKVCATYEEGLNSSGSLAFVDRSLVTKAFALDSDTGVSLWGYLGSCECPKQFLYKVMVSTGEGRPDQAGSVFNTDAFDTYSDQVLVSGLVEYTFTCKDWAFDEVDSRPCDKRCELEASLGAYGYYEDDDDAQEKSPGGLALRSTGPLDRWGAGAWFRARWQGWNVLAQFDMRNVDYTRGSTAEDQRDMGAELMLHYRFAESNWGVGARAGIIRLDASYKTIAVGNSTVGIDDPILEIAGVVNYFFWDHGNKISADVTWLKDNGGVNTSSAGYMFGASRGVIREDGIMFRVQWQIQF